jgi:hypothetical protein
MLYGEAYYCEVYTVADAYNSEVAMSPFRGHGMVLSLFEGPAMKQGESRCTNCGPLGNGADDHERQRSKPCWRSPV